MTVSSQIKQTQIPSCRAENLSISFSSPHQILTSLALEKTHKEPLSAPSYSWGAVQISVRFQGVTEQKPAQHAHLLKLSLSFCFDRLALCLRFPLHSDASLATATVRRKQREALLHPTPTPRSLNSGGFCSPGSCLISPAPSYSTLHSSFRAPSYSNSIK